MLLHLIFGDVLAGEPVVAFLQGGEVIPDDTRNVDRIMQPKIALRAIQAVFVGSANFNNLAHRFFWFSIHE
jgi:hypothetical protein